MYIEMSEMGSADAYNVGVNYPQAISQFVKHTPDNIVRAFKNTYESFKDRKNGCKE